jgi:hypothetical protein
MVSSTLFERSDGRPAAPPFCFVADPDMAGWLLLRRLVTMKEKPTFREDNALGRAARVLSHQHWAMTAGLLVETSRPLRLIGRPGPCKLSNSDVLGDREPVCLAIGSGSVKTSEPETDCPPRQAEPSDVLRVARAAGRDG